MQVRALVFDVFGTVVDWRGPVVEALADFGRMHQLDGDWGEIADRWRQGYYTGIDAILQGERKWRDVDSIHLEKLRELLGSLGPKNYRDEDLRQLNYVWHGLPPWPDAIPGLWALKTHFPVATLSNGNKSLLSNMAQKAGLPWDKILCAEEFGTYKPDKAVYLGAAEALACKPDELMLVAAHLDDLRAARECGLRTAFVPRPLEFGHGIFSPDLVADRFVDVEARDFLQLAEKLDSCAAPLHSNGPTIVNAVSAVAERDATGRTAEIFAEIREELRIPLVTSIWRTLDAIPNGLESVWEATRPAYASGWADVVLADLDESIEFEYPPDLHWSDFEELGLSRDDLRGIRVVLDAYNRSNGLNLIALKAFCSHSTDAAPERVGVSFQRDWSRLPKLASPSEIGSEDWQLLVAMSEFGATSSTEAVPTLWRHLAKWPRFLELTRMAFGRLQIDGSLLKVVDRVEGFVIESSEKVAPFIDRQIRVPNNARTMVHQYVHEAPSVARMVAVGGCVSKWINELD